MGKYQGKGGPLHEFLKDFGPTLLKKYNPKGIIVFSAHWETEDERQVTDYGDENPLLFDYYGFPEYLYKLKFKSRGDSNLANTVVELYNKAGLKARITKSSEPRGSDGRGFEGPGLDHGVFVPFRLMFGEEFTEIPIVQVSIDASLDPERNWDIGKAIAAVRRKGILILSGGLVAHNLRDRRSFSPDTATELHKAFDKAVHDAIQIPDAEERKKALFDLMMHPGFRAMHPREDHFVPMYVAGGAGEGGEVKTLADMYGIPTFAFGL
jgi:4,5-DOPA dioxygenase extradiol